MSRANAEKKRPSAEMYLPKYISLTHSIYFWKRSRYQRQKVNAASDVAVDDADDDNDGHTRDYGRGEDQPAVFEWSRNHVSEEDWTRVNRVV